MENFRSFCRDISCLSPLRCRRSDVYHVAFDSSALKITSTAPLLWSQWEFVEIPIHSSHCHPPSRPSATYTSHGGGAGGDGAQLPPPLPTESCNKGSF